MGESGSNKCGGQPSSRVHLVLIHGICGGAWGWYKIKSLLEISGFKVTCIDLKSAGIDRTDSDSVLTFEDYNQPLDAFMESLPDAEKVVLVGHSAGGISVTKTIHKYPNKVQGAVYLAGTMVKFGFQSIEDLRIGAPNLSEYDDLIEYRYGLGGDRPPTSALFKKEFLRKIVYPNSPSEDITLAAMLSRPGPLLALMSAKFGEQDDHQDKTKVDEVPRVYIKTSDDKLIKRDQQETMITNWKPLQVFDIDSDHTPFLSSPVTLLGLLLKAVSTFTSLTN